MRIRSTIVDPDFDGATALQISHPDYGAKWKRSMCRRQSTPVKELATCRPTANVPAAIPGRDTALAKDRLLASRGLLDGRRLLRGRDSRGCDICREQARDDDAAVSHMVATKRRGARLPVIALHLTSPLRCVFFSAVCIISSRSPLINRPPIQPKPRGPRVRHVSDIPVQWTTLHVVKTARHPHPVSRIETAPADHHRLKRSARPCPLRRRQYVNALKSILV